MALLSFDIESGRHALSHDVSRLLPGQFRGGPTGTGFVPQALQPSIGTRYNRGIQSQVNAVYPGSGMAGPMREGQAAIGSWNTQKQIYRTAVTTDAFVRRNFEISRKFFSTATEANRREATYQRSSLNALNRLNATSQQILRALGHGGGPVGGTGGGYKWGMSVTQALQQVPTSLKNLGASILSGVASIPSRVFSVLTRGGKLGGSLVGGGIGALAGLPFGLPMVGAGVGATLGGGLGGILGRLAPLLGLGVGAGGAFKNYRKGNYLGAGISGAAGLASITPGLGPLVGGGIGAIGNMIPERMATAANAWIGKWIIPAFEHTGTTIGNLLYKGVEKIAGLFGVSEKEFAERWGAAKTKLGETATALEKLTTTMHTVFTNMVAEIHKHDFVADIKNITSAISGLFEFISQRIDMYKHYAGLGAERTTPTGRESIHEPWTAGLYEKGKRAAVGGPPIATPAEATEHRWSSFDVKARLAERAGQTQAAEQIRARLDMERNAIAIKEGPQAGRPDPAKARANEEMLTKSIEEVSPHYRRWKLSEQKGMREAREAAGLTETGPGSTKQPGVATTAAQTDAYRASQKTTAELKKAIQESGGGGGGTTTTQGKTFSPEVEAAIAAAAKEKGIDPNIMRAYAQLESSGSPTAINPKSGAAGLFQFMPFNFKSYGLEGGGAADPVKNANAAARMIMENAKGGGYDVNADPLKGYLGQLFGGAGNKEFYAAKDQGAPLTARVRKYMDANFGKGMDVKQYYEMQKKKYEEAYGTVTGGKPGEPGTAPAGGVSGKASGVLAAVGTFLENAFNNIKKKIPEVGPFLEMMKDKGITGIEGMITGDLFPMLMSGNVAQALGITGPEGKAFDAGIQQALGNLGSDAKQQIDVLKGVFGDAMSGYNDKTQGFMERITGAQEKMVGKDDPNVIKNLLNPTRDPILESYLLNYVNQK